MRVLQDFLDVADQSAFDDAAKKEAAAKQRKRNNIMRAVEAVNREVSEYEVFDVAKDDGNGLQDSQILRKAKGKSR